MGTSDPSILRQLALMREMTSNTLVGIADDARDAKRFAEIIVQELKPEALNTGGPAGGT